MKMLTKEDLKQEIEQLDDGCLDSVFRLLQQFPHLQKTQTPDALMCSRAIDYDVEDNDDFLAFTDIDDAALFGRELRARAWQHNV
jgi:hypothetical protein